MKNYIQILAVMLFLVSCQDKYKVKINENEETFDKFPKEQKVTFENMTEFKGTTYSMLVIDDTTLVIRKTKASEGTWCVNYDVDKHTFSKGYVPKGRGPGETMSCWSYGIVGDNFWSFDIVAKKLLISNKDSLFKGKNATTQSYQFKSIHSTVCLTKNNKYLVAGDYDSSIKLQEFDLDNKSYHKNYGNFILSNLETPIDALRMVYESFLAVHPTGNKAVMAYRDIDAVEIYNLDSGKSKLIRGPIQRRIDFKVFRRGSGYGYKGDKNKDINTCQNIAVTNKYIYILFSGRLKSKGMNPDVDVASVYGKDVFVYDWEGNPIKRIKLDKSVMALAVSSNDKTIYSYDPTSGYLIKANINL